MWFWQSERCHFEIHVSERIAADMGVWFQFHATHPHHVSMCVRCSCIYVFYDNPWQICVLWRSTYMCRDKCFKVAGAFQSFVYCQWKTNVKLRYYSTAHFRVVCASRRYMANIFTVFGYSVWFRIFFFRIEAFFLHATIIFISLNIYVEFFGLVFMPF